jgi:hypothetical protein
MCVTLEESSSSSLAHPLASEIHARELNFFSGLVKPLAFIPQGQPVRALQLTALLSKILPAAVDLIISLGHKRPATACLQETVSYQRTNPFRTRRA